MPAINAIVVASVNRPWLLSLRGQAGWGEGYDIHHALKKAAFTIGESVVIVSHQEYFQMADDLAKAKEALAAAELSASREKDCKVYSARGGAE